MNIKILIDKIILPNDYHHRNGFNNTLIIDQLDDSEKNLVEEVLIKRLSEQDFDLLVIETLSYLKSELSLPFLYRFLETCTDEMTKIIVSASIFEINNDSSMINIAINSFEQIAKNKDSYYVFRLISTFYYLIKFRNTNVNSIIKEYTKNKEYLISYNAKKALSNLSNLKEKL